MRWKFFCCSLLLLSVGSTVEADDGYSWNGINPLSSASDLIAARGAPDFFRVSKFSGHITRTPLEEGGRQEDFDFELEVTSDYLLYRQEGLVQLFDYRLRRVITINEENQSFRNDSLFGQIGFLELESRNRQFLRQVIERTGGSVSEKFNDPFWTESELGVRQGWQGKLEIEDSQNENVYSYQDQMITTVHYLRESTETEINFVLIKFLRLFLQIHPNIMDNLVLTGRVPSRAEFLHSTNGAGMTKTVFVLRAADVVKAAYPIAPDFKAIYEYGEIGQTRTFSKLLNIALLAAGGNFDEEPQSLADYVNASRRSLEAGRILDAALTAFVGYNQYVFGGAGCARFAPRSDCDDLMTVIRSTIQNPKVQSYINALQLDPKKRGEEALVSLLQIEPSLLRDGYWLNINIAVILLNAQNRDDWSIQQLEGVNLDVGSRFLAGLMANPYISSVYKDVGDLIYWNYDTPLAWAFYDLGRTLPGHHGGDVISSIDQKERELLVRRSEYF